MENVYKKMSRHDALVNVINDSFDKQGKEISVPELARDIENYIKTTHIKRKGGRENENKKRICKE